MNQIPSLRWPQNDRQAGHISSVENHSRVTFNVNSIHEKMKHILRIRLNFHSNEKPPRNLFSEDVRERTREAGLQERVPHIRQLGRDHSLAAEEQRVRHFSERQP